MIRTLLLASVIAFLAPIVSAADPAKDAYGDPLPEGAVARFGTSRFRNLDGYYGLQFTPEGKHLIALHRGANTLFDVTTGLPGEKLKVAKGGYPQSIHLLSADGKVAASVNYDGVEIWEYETGAKIHSIKTRLGSSVSEGGAAISADGQFLAIGGAYDEKDKEKPVIATVWNLQTKKEVATVKVAQNGYSQVAISGDGKTLLTRGRQRYDANAKTVEPDQDPAKFVEIWDVATGKLITTIKNKGNEYAALSPDGKIAATSTGNGDVHLADTKTGKSLFDLAGRSGMGKGLYFSPDGNTLAAICEGASVQLVNTATGESIGFAESPMQGDYQTLRALRFIGNDKLVVASSLNSCTCVYEAPTGKRLSPAGGITEGIHSLCFYNGDKEILASTSNGNMLHWGRDGKELEPLNLRVPGRSATSSRGMVTFSPDGKFAQRNDDYGLGLYNLPEAVQRCLIKTSSYSYGSEYLASGNGQRGGVLTAPQTNDKEKPKPYQFFLTDVAKGVKLGGFEMPSGQISGASFSFDGTKLFCFRRQMMGNESETSLCGFELPSGKLLGEVKMKSGYGYQKILPTADGKSILVFQPDNKKSLFSMPDFKIDREFKTERELNPSLVPVFSPDGKKIAIATSSYQGPGEVLIFDFPKGDLLNTLKGHMSNITAMAFSTDGKSFATGSGDTTVLIWDLTSKAKD